LKPGSTCMHQYTYWWVMPMLFPKYDAPSSEFGGRMLAIAMSTT